MFWLSVGMATQGLWAFFAPRSFYGDFPLPEFEWVSMLGEFNDHLMRDFGAALVGLALVGVLTAMRRHPMRFLLIGHVVFAALHLVYHLTTGDEFGAGSFATQIAVLTALLIVQAALLLPIEGGEN